ncbi:MAG: anti-sigma factor [Planctomycetia bacterium]|nr:anti-sigma factor [Planctomycetia bacterium]
MTHEELRGLCGLHALGALDGEDRAALEAHLADCAECRREVAANAEAAAGVALALAPAAPSPEVRLRLQDAVAARTAVAPLVPRGSTPAWAVPAAAAAALLAGVWFGAKLEDASTGRGPLSAEVEKVRGDNRKLREANVDLGLRLAEARAKLDAMEAEALAEKKFMPGAAMGELAGVGGAAALGRVFWQGEEVHIMAANLPAPPEGRGYQVWALVEGMAPMPGAVFMPDREGLLKGAQRIEGVPAGRGVKFAVTLEPVAGVKAPTGPMVLEPPK